MGSDLVFNLFRPPRPDLTRKPQDTYKAPTSPSHPENIGAPTADTGPGTVPHLRHARDGSDDRIIEAQ